MDIIELIDKKKNKQKLSAQELQFFVDAVCQKRIKDYQTSAMLMAMFLNGLDFEETFNLTISMAKSGDMLDLSSVGECVDKHSTGGVSDTTTLVFVPILASLGVKVAKMSGRSLGWTGGTADKMEVFKGYQTEISSQKFVELIKKNNASIISQSDNFALADKILYKMRSETAMVDNMNLIASSIMSKKIASGAKVIILDVKFGSGAFMKSLDDAKQLAQIMVKIGKMAGLKVCAVLSDMNKPLTKYVGNNLEVYSAIKVLDGEENDLSLLSKYLCSKILVLLKKAKDMNEAQKMVSDALVSKRAKEKLYEIIKAQGGSTEVLDNPEMLLPKNNSFVIFAPKSGYLTNLDTTRLGNIAHSLQRVDGTMKRQDDVGIILEKQIGDYVNKGEKIFTIYYNQLEDKENIEKPLNEIYLLGDKKIENRLIECEIE